MCRPRERRGEEPRILVVVSYPLGGIRTYLLHNLPHLLKAGYRFTFLAPEGEAFEAFKNDVSAWPGVEFIGVPARKRQFVFWPSVRRAVRSRRFSLIHSQGLRAGTEVEFANLFRRVPHVITLHDTRHPGDFTGRFRWIKRQLAGRLSARADAIIAVSKDCAQNHLDFFPEWRRSKCKIEVVYNGVDVERLRNGARAADRLALRRQFGWGEEIRILGYFGRLMPEKGFLILLDALRELAHRGLSDRTRLIATKDPHGYREEYIREVEQDKVLSRLVQFVEPVTDISTLLPQVDIVVMPSLREACPLLPMEAMVLGVPVVGSDAVGLREILHGTPSLAPPSGDAVALASAIQESLCLKTVQRAQDFAPAACRRFDNQPAAEKLRQLHETLSR